MYFYKINIYTQQHELQSVSVRVNVKEQPLLFLSKVRTGLTLDRIRGVFRFFFFGGGPFFGMRGGGPIRSC